MNGSRNHSGSAVIIVTLAPKEPTVVTSAVRAGEAIEVEMVLQPAQAEAVIKQLGYREVNYVSN